MTWECTGPLVSIQVSGRSNRRVSDLSDARGTYQCQFHVPLAAREGTHFTLSHNTDTAPPLLRSSAPPGTAPPALPHKVLLEHYVISSVQSSDLFLNSNLIHI